LNPEIEKTSSGQKTLQNLGVVALLLVVWVGYLPYTDRTFECDEAYTLFHFATSFPRALFGYLAPNNHILHSVLVWLTTSLIGTSLIAVRFAALSGAMLSLAMAFRVGKRAQGYRVGYAAAGLLAANMGFAFFAVNARGYTLSIFLTLILIELAFLSRKPWQSRQRYVALLTSAFLLLLLPSMILVIVSVIVWLLIRDRRGALANILPILAGCFAAALIYLPAVLAGLLNTSLTTFGLRSFDGLFADWVELVFPVPLLGVVFAVAMLVGGWYLLTQKKDHPLFTAFMSVTITCLVVAAAQLVLTGRVFYGRNYMFLLAIFVPVAGVGLAYIAQRSTVPLILGGLIIVTIPLQFLDDPVAGDYMIAHMDNMATNEILLTRTCWNPAVEYYYIRRDESPPLWTPQSEAERIFVLVGTTQTLDLVLELENATDALNSCQPVTDGSWDPFEVYQCLPN